MKIAITAAGDDLHAPLDPRFGRAARFILYDTESKEYAVVDNEQNLNAPQGAGVQSAEILSRSGAECLLTGHCGPKAFRTLTAAGICVYTGLSGTVADAIRRFESGELGEASGADVEGHWQ
ncbi:MAG: NifB/NifX family molybdenum-iron cluster-binding protein [Acidobacteria bacterium]|nr:NifB/NifX family molybdenum-iron cluster-binding protein [Acidobacteriota bacterium]